MKKSLAIFTHIFPKSLLLFTAPFSICAQTLVTAERPAMAPNAFLIESKNASESPGSTWLKLSQNGINNPPSCGVLSPSILRFRGFSSSQLSVNIDGFSLSDPGTGLIDTNDLPFFAANNAFITPGVSNDSLGATINLQMGIPSDFSVKNVVSTGLRNFGQMSFLVSSGEMGASRLLTGIQLASSTGNYPFAASLNPITLLNRENNDHSRVLAVIRSQHALDSADLEFLALARHYEGGLPGPALFPTNGLRLETQKLLLGGLLSFELGRFPIAFRVQSKFDKTHTNDNAPESERSVSFMDNSVKLSASRQFEFADTFASVGTLFSSNQTLDGRFRRFSTKLLFDMSTAPFNFWNMRFQRSASFEYHSDVSWFLGFSTNISATPSEDLTFGLRFGKNSRPPTLSEMFAPQGIVLGNTLLEPEKLYDTSIYFKYNWNPNLKFDLELLYAYLAKSIFYVNRNSFFLEPVNADKVHRAGVGFSAKYSPLDILEFQLRADYLFSRITATDSPLPGTTPFSSALNTRIGREKDLHGKLGAIVNAGSSSNLFGTLKTDPYALINASFHMPLSSQVQFAIAATNLFDVKWAQSAYQYPMPGFEIFATMEFKS